MNAQLEAVQKPEGAVPRLRGSDDPATVFPTYSNLSPAPKFPSWQTIKKNKWTEIIKRYDSGARDKETVCARTSYMAASKACKGWPAGSFDELVNEGYAYALSRWGDYDPTKASANGISGFLYKSTLLTLRKIAQERFTFHGKRKHKPTDELPKIVQRADEGAIDRDVWKAPVTGCLKVDYNGFDDDDESAGGASISDVTTVVAGSVPRLPDAPINRFGEAESDGSSDIVRAAARGAKSGKLKPDHVKAPHSPSNTYLEHAANEQLRMRVSDLLALLPREEADLVSLWFGVNGVPRAMTVEELADEAECSVPTMYRRLNKLLEELLNRSKAAGV